MEPSGWDTPLWGWGPRSTPWSSRCCQNPHPLQQSPDAAVLRRDRARRTPREPVAGLGAVGNGQTGTASDGGTHPRPQPGGAGSEAGAGRQRELPGHACRGRDEADERQACRRRFIGDAQRLWQYVTPPALRWGCRPDPPFLAPHLLPLPLQPSRKVGLAQAHAWLGYHPPHTPPKKNVK